MSGIRRSTGEVLTNTENAEDEEREKDKEIQEIDIFQFVTQRRHEKSDTFDLPEKRERKKTCAVITNMSPCLLSPRAYSYIGVAKGFLFIQKCFKQRNVFDSYL